MNYNILENLSYCKEIVHEALPALLYAHIPTALVALFFGIFIAIKARKVFMAQIFLLICSTYFVWTFLNLSIWLNYDKSGVLMYAWSFIELCAVILFVLSFYFSYIFVTQHDMPKWLKTIIVFGIAPAILLAPTTLNLISYDIQECIAIENPTYLTYILWCKIVFTALTVLTLISGFIKADNQKKKEIGVLFVGIIGFLFAFLISGKISELTLNYLYEIYGLFAMFLFIGALAYLIVKFRAFNIRIFSVQVLVAVLVIAVGAQFTYVKELIPGILTSATLLLSIIFGLILIRSVKNTIVQKEELIKLNLDLKNLIRERENLVHLVTHKVKGSFTRSKYIFAGMLDGTFGEISPEIHKRAEQGIESDNMGIETVDLVLSVANMQKGIVKYDMKKFNFKDVVQKTIEEKKGPLETKGLKIENTILDGNYNVLGDTFWLKEVVGNLIENSIKYTKAGTITVGLEDGNNLIKFFVKDTGMGITDEDKKNLFTEGGRGKDSIKINVDSTGYGLYSVKLIIEAHHGRVWAESPGPGLGSTFFVELPAAS